MIKYIILFTLLITYNVNCMKLPDGTEVDQIKNVTKNDYTFREVIFRNGKDKHVSRNGFSEEPMTVYELYSPVIINTSIGKIVVPAETPIYFYASNGSFFAAYRGTFMDKQIDIGFGKINSNNWDPRFFSNGKLYYMSGTNEKFPTKYGSIRAANFEFSSSGTLQKISFDSGSLKTNYFTWTGTNPDEVVRQGILEMWDNENIQAITVPEEYRKGRTRISLSIPTVPEIKQTTDKIYFYKSGELGFINASPEEINDDMIFSTSIGKIRRNSGDPILFHKNGTIKAIFEREDINNSDKSGEYKLTTLFDTPPGIIRASAFIFNKNGSLNQFQFLNFLDGNDQGMKHGTWYAIKASEKSDDEGPPLDTNLMSHIGSGGNYDSIIEVLQ